MSGHTNPYVTGNPVGYSPAFVGRADILRKVLQILRRSQDNAVVLYGQRRIGKTSILQHLAGWLAQAGPYRPVYLDLQDKAAWPLGRLLHEISASIAHSLGHPKPIMRSDPETAFYHEWLPSFLSELSTNASLVLLFDEFDVLASPKSEQAAAAFFPYLRDLLVSNPKQMKFVFVIGRNVNDLTSIALSLFKGIPSVPVSLLSKDDSLDLIRIAEKNSTLNWSDDAVQRIWQLTHGHPLLTSQLCSQVWERAYDESHITPPVISASDVDMAVPYALEASRHTLEWLWDGLPPAERIVISAMAEAGPDPISQEKLEGLLREHGVQVVIRELQNAPQLLQEWDLVEPSDRGHQFRVELLRSWIAKHKPLQRVQDELDRIEPVAHDLYQAGLKLYRGGQLEQAAGPLRQAVSLNPNHINANQLLADVLQAQSQLDEAQQLLERLYEHHPAAARPRLVQVLLGQARAAKNESDRLTFYERVLRYEVTQAEAITEIKRIWREHGDESAASSDLESALEAYRKADLNDKVSEIENRIRERDLQTGLEQLGAMEQQRNYQEASELAGKLATEYSDMRDWQPDLDRLYRKIHLDEPYEQAIKALENGDRAIAQEMLVKIAEANPSYKEVTRHLHRAVTNVDVVIVQSKLEQEEQAHMMANANYRAEAEARHELEQNLVLLKAELKSWQQAVFPLISRNPLDQCLLLWWLLVKPMRLSAYRRVRGSSDEQKTGGWLVSTLTWLPFIILLVLLGVRIPSSSHSSLAYPFGLGAVLIGWALNGWRGIRASAFGRIVLAAFSGVIATGVTAVVIDSTVIGVNNIPYLTAITVVLLAVTSGLASSMALIAGARIAVVVAVGIAMGTTVGVAFLLRSIVLFVAHIAVILQAAIATTIIGGATWVVVALIFKRKEGETVIAVISLSLATLIVSLNSSIIEATISRVTGNLESGSVGIIVAVLIMSGLAFVFAYAIGEIVSVTVKQGLEAGQPTWLGPICFTVVLLSLGLILWLSVVWAH